MRGDFLPACDPDSVAQPGEPRNDRLHGCKPRRPAADAQMQADRQHRRAAVGRLRQQHIERGTDVVGKIRRRDEAVRMEEFHVVGVEAVGHDEHAPVARQGVPVGQVVVEGVGVVVEAELAKQAAGPGALAAAAHEANRCRPGRRGDGVARLDDVAALAVAIAVEGMRQPAPAVHGRLVAGLDRRPGEIGNALDCAAAHHEGGGDAGGRECVEEAP